MEKSVAVEFHNQLLVAGDSVGIAAPLQNEIEALAIELNIDLESLNLDSLRDLAETYLHKIINQSLNN